VATVPTAQPLTDTQPAQGSRGFPAWAIVLIAVAAVRERLRPWVR